MNFQIAQVTDGLEIPASWALQDAYSLDGDIFVVYVQCNTNICDFTKHVYVMKANVDNPKVTEDNYWQFFQIGYDGLNQPVYLVETIEFGNE